MKRTVFLIVFLVSIHYLAFADLWVDMGTFSDDGKTILWASGDLSRSGANYVFKAYGFGDEMTYNEAVRAVKDIGDGCRLPSFDEFKELINNCTLEVVKRGSQVYVKLVSKINGNILMFAIPEPYTKLESESAYITYSNAQIHEYWLAAKNSEYYKAIFSRYSMDGTISIAPVMYQSSIHAAIEKVSSRVRSVSYYVLPVKITNDKANFASEATTKILNLQNQIKELRMMDDWIITFFGGRSKGEYIPYTKSKHPNDLRACLDELTKLLEKEQHDLDNKLSKLFVTEPPQEYEPFLDLDELRKMVDIVATVRNNKNGTSTLQIKLVANDAGKKYGKQLLKHLKSVKQPTKAPQNWETHFKFNITNLFYFVKIKDEKGLVYQFVDFHIERGDNYVAVYVSDGSKKTRTSIYKNCLNDSRIDYVGNRSLYGGAEQYYGPLESIYDLPFVNLNNPIYYVTVELPASPSYYISADGDDNHYTRIPDGKIGEYPK